MDSSSSNPPLFKFSLLIMLGLAVSPSAHSSKFNFVNNCNYTVWPVVLSTQTTQIFPTSFVLEPGNSTYFSVPPSWSGRIWGRTLCTQGSSGNFSCLTGDCNSSTLECSGPATPPVTLTEFTTGTKGGADVYDVSLVDGYNLPMTISPHGIISGDCTSAGCDKDLNTQCPSELQVVNGSKVVACRSACGGGSQSQCMPTNYSRFHKTACPTLYTTPEDDANTSFTCSDPDYYVIAFCPSSSTRLNLPPSPASSPTYADGKCRDSNDCHRSHLSPSPSFTPDNIDINTGESKFKLTLTQIFIGMKQFIGY